MDDLPAGSRVLVYPGGRNARLAVNDWRQSHSSRKRAIVGFADDNPPTAGDDCKPLDEAVAAWNPSHVVVCARQPELEEVLVRKAQMAHSSLSVVTPKARLVQLLVPEPPAQIRPLSSIRRVTVVLCKTCNIRCNYCYQADFTQRMDPAIFSEKLAPVYRHANIINLVGGEVTAYRKSWPFVQSIPEKYPGTKLQLTTNGTFFDQEWAEIFCQSGDDVLFSLIAATPQTYHTITGADVHQQAVNNIAQAIRLRRESGSDFSIRIGMVITPGTQHEIEPMVRLAESLGADQMGFGVDAISQADLDFNLIEQQVDRVAGNVKIPIIWDRLASRFPQLATEQHVTQPCSAASDALFVEVNGSVFVCCHSHICIGSLRENDVETIWNSHAARAVEIDVCGGTCGTCPTDCIYRTPTVGINRLAWQSKPKPQIVPDTGLIPTPTLPILPVSN
ncbi:MAG: radical SAM protein [Planctomycetota bacterium]